MDLWATRSVVHKSTGPPGLFQLSPAQPTVLVDESEFDVAVADEPLALLGLLDRDRFADQRLADEDEVAGPLDAAVGAHPAHRGFVGIVGLAQGARVGARRSTIKRGWSGEVQGFVRPFVIVDGAEHVKGPLLLGERRLGRACGVFFQRAMQPLVPAVLLRLAGIDPLGAHAKLDPPHGKPRKPARADRSERRPVVRADRKRQTELAKRRVEGVPHAIPVGLSHGLAAQEIAAHRVADRQGIAALTLAGAKPALEVGAPHRIGRLDRLEWRSKGRTAPPRPARLREPLLAQPVADRADRRRRKIRPALGKLAAKLLGTPRGLALAQAQSRRHQLLLARSAMAVRRPAAVFQPLEALGPITLKPLIAGLAADPELDAELAHHRLLLARRRHKSHLLIHHPGLSPRHRQDPPRRALDLSAMYPVQSVSDLIGSNKGVLLPPLWGKARDGGSRQPGE